MQNYINQIIIGDSRNMHELPDSSVHLIVTSPPYNVGKDYEKNLSMEVYCQFLKDVMKECYRVLVNGGRICVNVANLRRKPYTPLNSIMMNLLIETEFLLRGEIIWVKGATVQNSCAWGSWMSPSNPILRDGHEYIVTASKGQYERTKDNDSHASITADDFQELTNSVWHFRPETSININHPAPFPVELPRRCIEMYTYCDDIVLDPFMGSGTTGVAAIFTKRRYVGYEIQPEYVKKARIRCGKIEDEKSQTAFFDKLII